MQLLLKYLAKFTLWRFEPKIVGATGMSGEGFVREAVGAVLKFWESETGKKVRVMPLRSEDAKIIFPLTIIADLSLFEIDLLLRRREARFAFLRRLIIMFKIFSAGVLKIFTGKRNSYPEVLVLGYPVSEIGDGGYFLEIARPDTMIMMSSPESVAHSEKRINSGEISREMSRLVEALPSSGFAVLNFDDRTVLNLKEKTRGRVITFGFGEGADLQITHFSLRKENEAPIGLSMKIDYGGSLMPFALNGVLGRGDAYAAAAAASVGLIFDLNLVEIYEALRKNYEGNYADMKVLKGVKKSFIIDACREISPSSIREGIEILSEYAAGRKIIVLGDMMNLGKWSIEAHEAMGKFVAQRADLFVTVGPRGKLMAAGAKRADLSKKKILSFDTAEEAGRALQDLIKEGDLILIKGAKELKMEKIVEEIKE